MTIENCLMFATLVFTVGISLYTFYKTNRINTKKDLYNELFALQKMAFDYPYLEDSKYTKTCLTLRQNYHNGTLKEDAKKEYLRYDCYCEMLFNFTEKCYNHFKSEKKILEKFALKEWVRNHKECWQSPIDEHSNHDIYRKEVSAMIDRWLK